MASGHLSVQQTPLGIAQLTSLTSVDISVHAVVSTPVEFVWREFNEPRSILQWDASPDWYTTWCTNDVCVGGRLEQLIEPRGGGAPIRFCATYSCVEPMRVLAWETSEGQRVRLELTESGGTVELRQTFSADPAVNVDVQRDDWQGVLDSFAQHVARLSA